MQREEKLRQTERRQRTTLLWLHHYFRSRTLNVYWQNMLHHQSTTLTETHQVCRLQPLQSLSQFCHKSTLHLECHRHCAYWHSCSTPFSTASSLRTIYLARTNTVASRALLRLSNKYYYIPAHLFSMEWPLQLLVKQHISKGQHS